MEENLLEERKLNIIEKLQKRFLVRKLSKNGEFDDWKKIGNEKLKYDQDIMNFALEIVKKRVM